MVLGIDQLSQRGILVKRAEPLLSLPLQPLLTARIADVFGAHMIIPRWQLPPGDYHPALLKKSELCELLNQHNLRIERTLLTNLRFSLSFEVMVVITNAILTNVVAISRL